LGKRRGPEKREKIPKKGERKMPKSFRGLKPKMGAWKPVLNLKRAGKKRETPKRESEGHKRSRTVKEEKRAKLAPADRGGREGDHERKIKGKKKNWKEGERSCPGVRGTSFLWGKKNEEMWGTGALAGRSPKTKRQGHPGGGGLHQFQG